ncbi:MAG: serine hydrolase [Bacteroidales bacterium]|nr:serine hydrolase [Bacteroidales bacterium]
MKVVLNIIALLCYGMLVLSSCCGSGNSDGYIELKRQLEEIVGDQPGKFGVAVIVDGKDTVTFGNSSYYPMMSMFKLHEAIAVCHALDVRRLGLDEEIEVRRGELDPDTWSPMLKEYTEDSFNVTVGKLIDYILVDSDNNASNLLFDRVISTLETDRYIRSVLPQDDFRIVYREADMKADISRSYDNRTSPLSYACLVDKLFTESVVSDVKQEFIIQAMGRCNTGMARIAAGLPEGVSFAHRTGSGYINSRGEVIAVNDGGYVLLPSGMGYSIAVLVKDFGGEPEEAEKVIAQISKAVYEFIAER